MAEDFLAENNLCGQSLLRLVSRANAIIAELLRLKDFIPSIFQFVYFFNLRVCYDYTCFLLLYKHYRSEQNKYREILSDFHYFKEQEAFDTKINASDVNSILSYIQISLCILF